MRGQEKEKALATECQLTALKELCQVVYTSPTALARARHELSVAVLSSSEVPAAGNLARLATEQGVFCPGELVSLREIGISLSSPWQEGQTAEKFIPSDYQLQHLVRKIVDSGKRLGIIFMVADMINAGHLGALRAAKKSDECDFLLLMMTTDLLTSRMKSNPENISPKLPFFQRIGMASQVEDVDGIYAVPLTGSHDEMTFEMVALAFAHEGLGVKFDDLGDGRIDPLNLKKIRELVTQESSIVSRQGENWEFYVMAYLGLSPYRHGSLDGCEGFCRPDVYPPELQISYRHLLADWGNRGILENTTLFVPDNDPKMAEFHVHQIERFSFFWGSSDNQVARFFSKNFIFFYFCPPSVRVGGLRRRPEDS